MFRIFYFNTIFSCNNRCLFCFSYNTYQKNQYIIDVSDISNTIKQYNISDGDRVIINGGEPTLHPNLLDMLFLFKKTGSEVVMYTNGRKFCNYDYCKEILEFVDRIVIPIHGTEKIHDTITQINGSFSETLQGLKNIGSLNRNKLEIKFIITQNSLDTSFCIFDFLYKYCFAPKTVTITGVVYTDVCGINNFVSPRQEDLGLYLSKQLKLLFKRFYGTIKLFDCNLCCLSSEVLTHINSLPLETDSSVNYEYYYSDGKYKNAKLLNYNASRSCKSCDYKMLCRSILDSCIVLELSPTLKKLTLE